MARFTQRLVPLCAFLTAAMLCGCSQRGELASRGLENQPIKAILFFAGEQLDGKNLRQNICVPLGGNITATFATAWPVDQSLLDWTQATNRLKAVQAIAHMGFNTLMMSTWGESNLPCSVACPYIPRQCCGLGTGGACSNPVARCSVDAADQQQCRIGWYGSANTQLSPASKDELFDAVSQTSLQIIPSIESRFDYEWNFRTDFPTSQDPRTQGQLAPGLISQVEDLLDRYVINPRNVAWKDHWALVYDKNGAKRRAIAIVQASSDSLKSNDDQQFAEAFDKVADKIYQDTCRRNACTLVGFYIDPIARDPISTYGCGIAGGVHSTYGATFKPDPDTTGPFLYQQNSVLGIDSYSPEGWVDGVTGPVNECFKISWKQNFSRRWQASGVPFIQDVTPGYDGSKLFHGPGLHTWGYDDLWRSSLLGMTKQFGRKGMIYNSWNGYDEGLAGMETFQQGMTNPAFIRALISTY
jgi:hypothetical protein